MNEKEAHKLLNDQNYRRVALGKIKEQRAQIRLLLNPIATPCPIVDSLVETYLQGADNNLYLAEITIKAMLEAHE